MWNLSVSDISPTCSKHGTYSRHTLVSRLVSTPSFHLNMIGGVEMTADTSEHGTIYRCKPDIWNLRDLRRMYSTASLARDNQCRKLRVKQPLSKSFSAVVQSLACR